MVHRVAHPGVVCDFRYWGYCGVLHDNDRHLVNPREEHCGVVQDLVFDDHGGVMFP